MRERLYRSRHDRMLFGVAGGMAEWMKLDPSIVRIVWALLVLAGGAGIVLYVVAAIVVPEAPVGAAGMADGAPGAGPAGEPGGGASYGTGTATRQGAGGGGMIFGLVLVGAGVWFLLDRYIDNFDTSWFVPGALIVIGIALVLGALRRSRGTDA